MLDGAPCTILENEFVKPGKGQAFNRVKLRNLLTGRILEKTFRSGETLPSADVIDINMQYLYNDGHLWYFMSHETFEQQATHETAVGDAKQWLIEQDIYIITLWNNEPIAVTPPNFVNLKVTHTDPGIKGDTVSGGTKPATLETGAIVRVPLFINVGDSIKIDTRQGEYVSRVKS